MSGRKFRKRRPVRLSTTTEALPSGRFVPLFWRLTILCPTLHLPDIYEIEIATCCSGLDLCELAVSRASLILLSGNVCALSDDKGIIPALAMLRISPKSVRLNHSEPLIVISFAITNPMFTERGALGAPTKMNEPYRLTRNNSASREELSVPSILEVQCLRVQGPSILLRQQPACPTKLQPREPLCADPLRRPGWPPSLRPQPQQSTCSIYCYNRSRGHSPFLETRIGGANPSQTAKDVRRQTRIRLDRNETLSR